MHPIAFGEKQFGELGAILAGDASDQREFSVQAALLAPIANSGTPPAKNHFHEH
jgi:hypothetical protein